MHYTISNKIHAKSIDSLVYLVNRLSTWYENLEEYEGNLEEMATATLDQVMYSIHSNNKKKKVPRFTSIYNRRFKMKCNMSINGLAIYPMQKRLQLFIRYFNTLHKYKSDSLYICYKK
jgi:hypothetical protein